MIDLNQHRDTIISTLNTLKMDAEMALNGDWDVTGSGGPLNNEVAESFEAQINLIDEVLNLIEDEKEQTMESTEKEE